MQKSQVNPSDEKHGDDFTIRFCKEKNLDPLNIVYRRKVERRYPTNKNIDVCLRANKSAPWRKSTTFVWGKTTKYVALEGVSAQALCPGMQKTN
jgi:hypothetical protein